jgi:seryl-tRNA synthetase
VCVFVCAFVFESVKVRALEENVERLQAAAAASDTSSALQEQVNALETLTSQLKQGNEVLKADAETAVQLRNKAEEEAKAARNEAETSAQHAETRVQKVEDDLKHKVGVLVRAPVGARLSVPVSLSNSRTLELCVFGLRFSVSFAPWSICLLTLHRFSRSCWGAHVGH